MDFRRGQTNVNGHTRPSPCVPAAEHSRRHLSNAPSGPDFRVPQHSKRLLQRFQILWADEHSCRRTDAGDHHSFVVLLDPLDELGEPVAYRTQGLTAHGHSCATPRASWDPTRLRRPPFRRGSVQLIVSHWWKRRGGFSELGWGTVTVSYDS